MGWGSAFSAGIPVMTDNGLSPHRDHAISTNSDGGHGGMGLGCTSIFSWGEAVGISAFLVLMGQLTPWAIDRDPLGWAQQLLLWLWSCWASSAGWGKLISIQLEGRASLRTSSSVKETSGSITCQSSNTLSTKQQGLLGISSCTFSAQYWRAFM